MLLRIPKRFWTKRKKIYTVIPGRLRAARYLHFHKHKKGAAAPCYRYCGSPFVFGSLNYFTMLATSDAKSSARFSRPSPLTKRANLTILISPPKSLATLAVY